MSDERSTEPSTQRSAELSTALREFAAAHETPTVLTGSEVRGRAVRRARRRVAGTLVAGAAALALVGVALTLTFAGEGNQRQVPAAPPAVPSPVAPTGSAEASSPAVQRPVAAGTVDLGKRILTVGDRVMWMTSDLPNSSKLVGPLTVYRKHATETETVTVTDPTTGTRYIAKVSLAVELRDGNNEPVHVGFALSFDETDGDKLDKYDTGGGWIGLDAADAKWFYSNVKTGTVLSVTDAAS